VSLGIEAPAHVAVFRAELARTHPPSEPYPGQGPIAGQHVSPGG
jgi:hypothetical protein